MNLEYYVSHYQSMSSPDLVAEFNLSGKEPLDLPRLLVIATYLVSRALKASYEMTGGDLDSASTISLTVVQTKMAEENFELTLDFLYDLIEQEGIHFQTATISYSVLADIPQYSEPSSINKIAIDFMFEDLMRDTPSHLSLLMYSFIRTYKLLDGLYSDGDRQYIHWLLQYNGINMEQDVKFRHFDKMTSTAQRVLFLYYLRQDYPDIFILLTSIKDVNALLLLTQYRSLRNVYNRIVPALDESACRAMMYLDKGNELGEEYRVYSNIAETIMFDANATDVIRLMSNALDTTHESFNALLNETLEKAATDGNLTKASQLANTENQHAMALLKSFISN